MEEEIRGVFSNLKGVVLECAHIAAGSYLILLSYTIFSFPSFDNFKEKALTALNIISGRFVVSLVFILISYYIGFILPLLIIGIPVSKKRKLFESTGAYLDTKYIKMHQFLHKEENKGILSRYDVHQNGRKVIRSIGSALFFSVLIFIITFISTLNWVFLLLSLLSILAVILIDRFHKDSMEFSNALSKLLAEYVAKEGPENNRVA